MAYTKEFLIEAYISRYLDVVEDIDALCSLEENAVKLYDRVGRDEFRKYASLDAEAIRIFKLIMAELWVAKLDTTVYFDTKKSMESLGIPRFKDEATMLLTEKEYEEYTAVVDAWHHWQNRLANA